MTFLRGSWTMAAGQPVGIHLQAVVTYLTSPEKPVCTKDMDNIKLGQCYRNN